MTSYLGLWLDMPEGCLLATNHRIRTAMKSQSSLKEEAASGLMLFVFWFTACHPGSLLSLFLVLKYLSSLDKQQVLLQPGVL